MIFQLLAFSSAPYLFFIAIAHILLATLPITEYSGSIPFEKKKERFGANSSTGFPVHEIFDISKSVCKCKSKLGDGICSRFSNMISAYAQ